MKFVFRTPDHNVVSYHPAFGMRRRVPTGVTAFSSPLLGWRPESIPGDQIDPPAPTASEGDDGAPAGAEDGDGTVNGDVDGGSEVDDGDGGVFDDDADENASVGNGTVGGGPDENASLGNGSAAGGSDGVGDDGLGEPGGDDDGDDAGEGAGESAEGPEPSVWLHAFEEPGVYDLLCSPHEHFGMVMRVVVGDETEAPFETSDPEALPEPRVGPAELARATLTDPALDPENIVDEETVSWDDLEANQGDGDDTEAGGEIGDENESEVGGESDAGSESDEA